MATQVRVDYGSTTTVRLSGEIDLSSGPILQALLSQVSRGCREFVVDVGGVSFMDCRGLTTLLMARELAHARGGTLSLQRVPPPVRRVIELTGAPLSVA